MDKRMSIGDAGKEFLGVFLYISEPVLVCVY